MKKTIKNLIIYLLLIILLFNENSYANGYKKVFSKKNPVEHVFFKDGNLKAHLIKVDLNHPRIIVDVALAHKSTNKKEIVSKIAQREKAIAAINGSFFHSKSSINSAVGLLMLDGVVISDSGHRRTSLGITEDKKIIIGIPKITNIAMMPEIGINLRLNGINQIRGRKHNTLYTPLFGKTTKTISGGKEIIIKDGKIVGYGNKNSSIPKEGFVISIGKSEPKITEKYPIGTQVFLNSALGTPWNKVKTLITGSPQLLKNGKIYNTYYKEKLQASIKGPAKRTAVGVTATNKLLLITVTGGVTFGNLAKMLLKLGARDALALDGGGSTEMYLKGKNMTSNYRPVTNAIVVKFD